MYLFFGGGGGWGERGSKNRIADFELPDDKVSFFLKKTLCRNIYPRNFMLKTCRL